MGKPCDAGGKGSSHICVDQGELGSFIIIFIMHILDQIQDIDVNICQPVHHAVVFLHHLMIVQIFRSDRLVLRPHLIPALLVPAPVDGIEQALRQIGSGPEKLHLLPGLGGRYTAADGIIIPPYRFHDIIVLVLDGAGADGNISRIFLKVLRQGRGVQHRDVRLWGRSHIFQCMEKPEICLRHHMPSVHPDPRKIQGGPDRITGKQFII